MEGRTLSHYQILEKIGGGGMGVVYRARDERLDRDVALKVLPAGMLADEATRQRFRKEALALSKLNHPNIETVFDFDTQEGVDFLVMEYVPGETLTRKLASGALPEQTVAALGAQVAGALEEAHDHGVVHRDLKPGNIMVTPKGQVKVLDFGLAKLLRPATETATTESLTEPEGIAGTMPYMAPEQLLGGKTDARSDLWAAGVVLYEMATGRRPFPDAQGPRLIDAILHQAPAPPRTVNRRVSAGLESVILKALERDTAHRYQSAKDLRLDLERGPAQAPVAATPRPRADPLRSRRAGRGRIRALAVLPLTNLSRDPEQEYFVDGMTEALITDLAKIGALRVISRTSAMRFKGTDKPLPEIARELNVDAVVEGSVLRAGDRVRITAQLIHAATDTNLWAESYERDLRDVLTLQSEVAKTIVQEVQIKLTAQDQARLSSSRRVNPQAYEAYLKGRYSWNKRTEEGLKKGIEFFRQAIEKDPTYALAYTGLADSYNILGQWGGLAPRESFPLAKAAAVKALEMGEGLAEAHCSLAYVSLFYDWDLEKAETEFRRAIGLNPGYALAHCWYGDCLTAMARTAEALREFRRAQDLDPLSLVINAAGAWALYLSHRYDEVIEHLLKVNELDPDFVLTHLWLGQAYEQKGMHDEAIAEFHRAVALSGRSPVTVAALAHAYAMASRRGEMEELLEELKAESRRRYVSSYLFAEIYAGLGDKTPAFEALEKAREERYPHMVVFKAWPKFEPLRADPRFADLVGRLGLPPG